MPKTWVEKNKLKKGDLINIDESSEDLILSPNSIKVTKDTKEITIEVQSKSLDLIRAEIVSAYLNNYNTIEIMGKELDTNIIKIKEIVRNLTGLEIMEETSTRLVAKDLIDINDISINTIIRRMDMITRAMIDDTILCLDKKFDYRSINHRDADINRLYYLGFRSIKNAMNNSSVAKKFNMDNWNLHCNKMVLLRIEEIADRQKRISRLLSKAELKDESFKEIREIKVELRNKYLSVMKAYYNNDKNIAFEIEITNREFIKKCDKLFENITRRSTFEIRKGSNKPGMLSKNILPAAKVIEYLKSTSTFIKYIARTVLNMD